VKFAELVKGEKSKTPQDPEKLGFRRRDDGYL
jgi:hypothetical protein